MSEVLNKKYKVIYICIPWLKHLYMKPTEFVCNLCDKYFIILNGRHESRNKENRDIPGSCVGGANISCMLFLP